MNREEYISEIKKELGFMPHDEIQKAEQYFRSYFSGTENDEDIIYRLGAPADAAKRYCRMNIKTEEPQKNTASKRNYTGIVIAVIAAVFLFPVWMPVLILSVILVVGIIIAAFAVSFGTWFGGGAMILSGIINHAALADKLLQCGIGFLMFAVGLMLSWLIICGLASLSVFLIRRLTR